MFDMDIKHKKKCYQKAKKFYLQNEHTDFLSFYQVLTVTGTITTILRSIGQFKNA